MRKSVMAVITVCCLGLAVFIAGTRAQQDKSKRPSPPASTKIDLGGKSVSIDYSSPRAKGRTIYGGLVPYGQVWRTGANESTTLTTAAMLMVGSAHVPPGTYTLFTIPEKDKWTLIISKKTGEWGTEYPGKENDLARVDMKVSALPAAVENFTITLEKAGNGANLNIDWATTRASVPVSAM